LATKPDDIDQIVATHGSAVWRTISRLLGGQQESADCFQDTFLEFIRVAQRRRIVHSEALLRTIATRRAIDAIRRKSADRRRLSPLDDEQKSAATDPQSSASGRELADWLRNALKDIDPLQATVFCMTQLDQMDREQVAAAMSITANHVSVLLHRARIKLQEKLGENAEFSRGKP
jgi:RNA polymerase sigma factor (sigma-70 family)